MYGSSPGSAPTAAQMCSRIVIANSGKCRADVLDSAQFLRSVVAGDSGGLLRVLPVSGCLPAAIEFWRVVSVAVVVSSSRRFQNSSAVSGMSSFAR